MFTKWRIIISLFKYDQTHFKLNCSCHGTWKRNPDLKHSAQITFRLALLILPMPLKLDEKEISCTWNRESLILLVLLFIYRIFSSLYPFGSSGRGVSLLIATFTSSPYLEKYSHLISLIKQSDEPRRYLSFDEYNEMVEQVEKEECGRLNDHVHCGSSLTIDAFAVNFILIETLHHY